VSSTAASVQDFAQLADLMRGALLLVNGSGEVLAASSAAQELLGRKSGELAGQPLHEFTADEPTAVASLLRAASRSRSFVPGSLTARRPDGKPLPCRCDGALFRVRSDMQPAQIALRLEARSKASPEFVVLRQKITDLSREIHARRAAEEALAQTSARYRVTLESIGDAVIATDAQGQITFLNPVAEQLTGWSLSDASGRSLDDVFVIVNEQTRETVESPVSKVLRLGTIVGLANHTVLLRRDGVELPIDDSGAPIRDDEGRIVGVVLVFRDLSERYALERELLHKTSRLEEADRRKNEFLAMLAHELRNPLAPLRTGVEFIRRHPLSAPIARTTEIMARQIGHMVRLVDDLLDVARVTQGKFELRLASLQLSDLVRHAEEMMRPPLEAAGLVFETAPSPTDAMLQGDMTRLVQVLGNLLSNAAKFSSPGQRVTMAARVEDGHAIVTVSDEGAGIDAASLPHLFDLFFQGNPSLDRTQGGLGVGLTIALSIARMHGGSIQAHSEGRGKGSQFSVRLPLLA
jgi:PAS domain S-box-containing protein